MTEHGRPQVTKSPSQKTEEQRVKECENDTDDALLRMSQPEEKRRQCDSDKHPVMFSPKTSLTRRGLYPR